MCIFIQVNLAQKGKADIYHYKSSTGRSITFNRTLSTSIGHQNAIGFDIHGLSRLLALPRQLRKGNPYSSKLITISESHVITKIISGNLGLELQWKPPSYNSFIAGFLKNVITIALGFVPGVGPLLSVSFALGWIALTDPDRLREDLQNAIPALGLTNELIEQFKNEAAETRKYLPDGWEKAGKSFMFAQALPPQKRIDGVTELNDAPVEKASLDGIGLSWSFRQTLRVLGESRDPAFVPSYTGKGGVEDEEKEQAAKASETMPAEG